MPKHWDKFEEMGEEAVKKALANNTLRADRRQPARDWLMHKAQERAESSKASQIDIARSAKDAAWVAADTAREAVSKAQNANRIATAAVIIAAISAAILFAKL